MSDATAATLYANDVELAKAIDDVEAGLGSRVRTLEEQLRQMQNLITNMRRQNANISATLTTGVHGEFTTRSAAREIRVKASSRVTDPGCANCSS